MFRHLIVWSVSLLAVPTAFGVDAAAGKTLFRQQCVLCHSAEPDDGGGALGPNLQQVFGGSAASQPGFNYTPALKNSQLTWDAATLDRFLAAPTKVVPGSSMVAPVPLQIDRDNVIAYLQGVKNIAPKAAAAAPQGAATAPAKSASWKDDQPGRVHHVTVAGLPAPFATESARNSVSVVSQPSGAQLAAPAGFKVEVFVKDSLAGDRLDGPRVLRVAPNGDVFVSEMSAGRIKVLRPSADNTKADSIKVFVKDLEQPFGMQFYPAGPDPQWLYVAEVNRVVRFAYKNGQLEASNKPEVVVPQLSPTDNGHRTRDIAFSPDGKRMYISVGSLSNVAQDMKKKSAAEIRAWESQYGLGASWGSETHRAAVLVYEVGSNKPGKTFATGIRNCVGLTVQPANGEVWCTTNERDGLGDDLVPDYTTRVKEGGYYGWPWYYLGNNEDPRQKGARPDLAGKAIVPDVLFTAHSAALNLTFYTATSGSSAFPNDYVGDAFAVLHGSWNRGVRTGHKVVRVRMKANLPTGEYEDFLTGFIVDDSKAWGRPVAVAVARDGSLLLSEDGNNVIYRISYRR